MEGKSKEMFTNKGDASQQDNSNCNKKLKKLLRRRLM